MPTDKSYTTKAKETFNSALMLFSSSATSVYSAYQTYQDTNAEVREYLKNVLSKLSQKHK